MPPAVIEIISSSAFVLIKIKTESYNCARNGENTVGEGPATFEEKNKI